MRKILPALLVLLLHPVLGAAEEEEYFDWTHEGYGSLLAAAGQAKMDGKRLLLGLSGSPT